MYTVSSKNEGALLGCWGAAARASARQVQGQRICRTLVRAMLHNANQQVRVLWGEKKAISGYPDKRGCKIDSQVRSP